VQERQRGREVTKKSFITFVEKKPAESVTLYSGGELRVSGISAVGDDDNRVATKDDRQRKERFLPESR